MLMALFNGKKSVLKAAIKQTTAARTNEGAKSDQLFISAYKGYAEVVKDDLVMGEALYNWGFALLHQAKVKTEEEGVKLYLEAISKFTFCLLVEPNHLGAAIDGGVAYMDLACIMDISPNDELYDLAKEFFDNAERIQRGSAAYNLACIYGLRGQEAACLEALETSKEHGSLPSEEDIVNDVDLNNIKNTQWFSEFLVELTAEPEPEVVDDSIVTYDVEGNVVGKNKKKKQPEYEVDGVVYDVEGSILRTIDDDQVEEEGKEPEAESVPEDINKPSFMGMGLKFKK